MFWVDISTTGRLLLTLHDRSCYLLVGGGWVMVLIEAGCDGRPGLATLETSDTEAVVGLFNRLSPESIYRRFFSPISTSDRFCASMLWVDKREREAVAA